MTGQYRVDLNELDLAVSQIHAMIRRMESATQKVRYATGLDREAVGTGFDEAYGLYAEHAASKAYLEELSAHLIEFAEDFSRKLRKTRGAYEDAEYPA
jgi:hypothetical protein